MLTSKKSEDEMGFLRHRDSQFRHCYAIERSFKDTQFLYGNHLDQSFRTKVRFCLKVLQMDC